MYLRIHRLSDLITLRLPLQDVCFFFFNIPSGKTEGLYIQTIAIMLLC